MRPVGITLVSFMYLTSISFLIAEVLILAPSGITLTALDGSAIEIGTFISQESEQFQKIGDEAINPRDEDSNIFERISLFAQGGYDSIWTLLSLLSGTYFFNFLAILGLPSIFLTALKLIFGIIVASTVVYYLTGRG